MYVEGDVFRFYWGYEQLSATERVISHSQLSRLPKRIRNGAGHGVRRGIYVGTLLTRLHGRD